MSISTKAGDKGTTDLWSGERVSKDNVRVEAFGTVDELDAHIAEAKNYVKLNDFSEILESIQFTLKRVMTELATKQIKSENDKTTVKSINANDVETLTSWVMRYEKNLEIDKFTISGRNIPSAKLDICRTVARRAERAIITLSNVESLSEHILAYINRLSDLLFVMAVVEGLVP